MLLRPSRRKIKRLEDLVGYEDSLIFVEYVLSPVPETIALLEGFHEKLRKMKLCNVLRVIEDEEDGTHIFINDYTLKHMRSVPGLKEAVIKLHLQTQIDMVKDGLERGVLKRQADGYITGDPMIRNWCRVALTGFLF